MKKLISYSVFLFYISFSFGQNRVSGYVVDNNSNLPIENVAIYDNYSGISKNQFHKETENESMNYGLDVDDNKNAKKKTKKSDKKKKEK